MFFTREDKKNAHKLISNAVKKGVIKRSPYCSKCKRLVKTVGHHPDYSRPLHVEWLCSKCHFEEHEKIDSKIPWIVQEVIKINNKEKNVTNCLSRCVEIITWLSEDEDEDRKKEILIELFYLFKYFIDNVEKMTNLLDE